MWRYLNIVLADITGHTHRDIYAHMDFESAADFQAACRAVRDMHGLSGR